MINQDNQKWLIVIAVVLVGIFTVMLIGITDKPNSNNIGESINSMVDSAGDSAREFKEEVADEIDDNTTDRR